MYYDVFINFERNYKKITYNNEKRYFNKPIMNDN